MNRANILITGQDVRSIVQEGIEEVKALIRYFKKIKIASFNSMAAKADMKNSICLSLFSLIFGSDSQAVLIREFKDGHFINHSSYMLVQRSKSYVDKVKTNQIVFLIS